MLSKIVVASVLALAAAQVSEGGRPLGLTAVTGMAAPPAHRMPSVNVAALLEEDEAADKNVPFRFAQGFDVELSSADEAAGLWKVMPDGSRVWRAHVSSAGAYSLNFVFSEYELFPGNKLFVYSSDGQEVLGAFTEANNKPNGQMATSILRTDDAIIELDVAPGAKPGRLTIGRINHGYRPIGGQKPREGTLNFGSSGRCNINAVCPESEGWEDQVSSVAMILTSGGSRLCSGSLIGTTNNDTDLFLTANHCLGGSDNWVFVFNYQSPICPLEDQVDGPLTDSVQGSTIVASKASSDFALLRLAETIPRTYNVYFNGWSATDAPAPASVGIHHPRGDVKKFSMDFDPTTSSEWSFGEQDTHWRVNDWDVSTTEGGSSGSPLFDATTKRVTGQLHGGSAGCSGDTSVGYDVYGKVARSFTDGSSPSDRLQDHLDNAGLGIVEFDGYAR